MRVLVYLFLLLVAPAATALTRAELDTAGFHLTPGTMLPGDVVLQDAAGGNVSVGRALDGRPSLVLFVDYGCQTLCGVILDGLGAALDAVDLRPGIDYRVLVVPLDPRSTTSDLIAFRDRHTAGTRLHDSGMFFTGERQALAHLRAAVGLVVPFDAENQQFAHPAGLVLVDSAGRAQKVLPAFAVDPLDLKLGLTEGAAAPSLGGHALLLCYGWDAASGLYTLQIRRLLGLGCLVFLALVIGPLAWHLRRERLATRGPAS